MRSLAAFHSFLAVAEHGSFSRAAAALGVSPSAVSQAVQGLEAELGEALLLRTTRSVALTEAGRRLVSRGGPGLRQALSALDEAASGGEVSGLLRLSVPSIAFEPAIAPVLPLLVRDHPGLQVEVSINNRMIDIVASGFDAGVRLGEAIERDMTVFRLTRPFRFVVVGSPAYLERRGRPRAPRDLARHACVVFRAPSTGALARWDLERDGRSYEVAVEGPLLCDSAEVMARAARDGLGLAYLYEPMVEAALADGSLEVVLDRYAPSVPGFFLYFARNARSLPKLQAFLRCARLALPR
jgi:DNA-binding transcriptional LysR family regulator